MSEPDVGRPLLRVVRGEPTPEELAALVAVLSARADDAAAPGSARRPAWNDPSRLVRTPVHARQGGWRASGLPK